MTVGYLPLSVFDDRVLAVLETEGTIMIAETSVLASQPTPSVVDFQKYRGRWVAVALADGRVLASGDSVIEAAASADALGISPAEYLLEPIPAEDTLLM